MIPCDYLCEFSAILAQLDRFFHCCLLIYLGLWSRIFRKRNRAPEPRDPSSPTQTLSVLFSAERAAQSDHSDRQPTRSGSLSAEKERSESALAPTAALSLSSLGSGVGWGRCVCVCVVCGVWLGQVCMCV